MKNLKLLCQQDGEVLKDVCCFTLDSDTSKFYVASGRTITGYNNTSIDKCFDVDLSGFGLLPDPKGIQIVGMQFMCGEEQLCVALKHGDIVLCGTTVPNVESVGCLDSEIQSMSWSPDQEIVLLVTLKGTVVAMTHDFDPISELEISSEEFGEGSFVNVGWGSKETQFQGSAGKYIPGKSDKQVAERIVMEDKTVSVAWRGDGQYFAVSSVDASQRRFRVWNRNCELQYTSETIPSLESCFTWKPSGSLIASAQRKVHRHDVVFFELNGLQHGEFTLPFECKQVHINKLQWNCDSTILALLATDLDTNHMYLQLWSVSNYHWSLKYCIEFEEQVSWLGWDEEHALDLHIVFIKGVYTLYQWTWCISCCKASSMLTSSEISETLPKALSLVAVVDGKQVKITPFKYMTVPPPMCAYQFLLKENVQQVCFSDNPMTPNNIAVLTNNGSLIFVGDSAKSFDSNFVDLKIMAMGGNGFKAIMSPITVFAVFDPDTKSCPSCPKWWRNLRHLVWQSSEHLFAVTLSAEKRDCIVSLNLNYENKNVSCTVICTLNEYVVSLCSGLSEAEDSCVIAQLKNGKILKQSLTSQQPFLNSVGEVVHLSCSCPDMQVCELGKSKDNTPVYACIALSSQKRLYLNNNIVSSECTSFAVHSEYIIYTTSSHKLVFIKRDVKTLDIEKQPKPGAISWLSENQKSMMLRSVERGATLVVTTPYDTKTILQLPRGNLEQIHPRPLVISVVKGNLSQGKYKSAFTLMRKHRINMNLFHDHDNVKFFSDISNFVKELDSVEYLNLFLSDLKEEDVTVTMYDQFYPSSSSLASSLLVTKSSKVDKICNAVMEELIKADKVKYFLSILTAHIRKSSPEIEDALARLKCMKESEEADEKLINDALRHLHVMVDGRVVYMEALATYDLDLALAVAQVSNNDPKEYIPFLNELRDLDENYRRYKIDMFLKKYKRALINISKCPDCFSDCVDLILSQNLHRDALDLFGKYTPQYREISNLYAEALTASHSYEEAGIILARCENHKRAIKCFMKGGNWQHALNCASHLNYSEKEYVDCAKTLSDTLLSKNRFLEAATVLEEEAKDCAAAVAVLCKGHFWREALRLIRKYKLQDLTDTHLIPALNEAANSIYFSLISDREQYDKYFSRLLKVREIKEKQQIQNLMNGDGGGDLDSDIASDFGSTVTGSSQSSTYSRTSARTSKSRRKHERKRFSLREGSRFEEEGLLQALRETILKFTSMKDDLHSLILHLSLFHLDKGAKSLQELYTSTHELFIQTKSKIWVLPDTTSLTALGAQSTVNSIIAARSNGFGNTSLSFTDLELAIPPKIDMKLKFGMHIYRS